MNTSQHGLFLGRRRRFWRKTIILAVIVRSGTALALMAYCSIRIEESSLVIRLAYLPVLSNKHAAHDPSQNRGKERESSARAHCDRVSWLVRVWPEIWRVNWRDGGNRVHESHCDSLLLFRLPTGAGDPSKNDTVASVDAARKDAHGEVSSTGVGGCSGENKAQYGDCFGNGDVPVHTCQSSSTQKLWGCSFAPSSLIHTARVPRI